MLAEMFGIRGAGLAGGFGESGGKGPLVLAGVDACRVARVGDFDCGRNEWAKRRVHVERGEESFARWEVGTVEHFGQDVGIESAKAFGDELVLAGEVLVERALRHFGHSADLVDAGVVDALIAEELL